MDKEISIFLDTNIIQAFTSGKKGSNVFLHNLGIRKEYYILADFIDSNRLEDRIEICIPEIVIREMKYHMKSGFERQLLQLSDQIREHKKMLGNLADFSAIEMKYNDSERYAQYVDSLIDDFFNTPKNYAKQVPFPRQGEILDVLVGKAISGVRPFFVGKIESKLHSDAGFKDSVIAETIYEYSKAHNRLCIFVTHDTDFSPEFAKAIQPNSRLVLFPSIETAIEALSAYYGTDALSHIQQEFTENTYWQEYLLNESGMKLDESVTEYKVDSVSVDEGDILLVKLHFVINEVTYRFFVKFDSAANDMIEFSYETEDD